MAEEKKEIESPEEDEKIESDEEFEKESDEAEDKKSEEEKSPKDGFEKDSEVVPAGKYNQAVRKQREMELEKRELERKLAEMQVQKPEKKVKEDEEDDDFFKDEEAEEKEIIDPSKIIDEKLKPVLEKIQKREESDRKNARTTFFESHPEYRDSAEKWQELLDELENSINPNSKDDHYTQLEKAHRILAGNTYNAVIEDKKAEIASDSSGAGAEKSTVKEEFNAEDRKIMKDMNISVEGMRAFKKDLAEGRTSIL